MIKRGIRGQEAIEFALIAALVFFAGLFVVLIFGSTISGFFSSKSSIATTSGTKAAAINATSIKNYQQSYNYLNASNTTSQNYEQERSTVLAGVQAALPGNSSTVAIPSVTQNPDNTVTFTAGNQTVTIPSTVNDLSNAMYQTTGSAGVPDIIREITYMIQTHQAEYAGQQVPVEVSFGKGTRSLIGENYEGSASVNSTSVKVGKHVVVIQKDHRCTETSYSSECRGVTDGRMGTLRIEGNVDNNSGFNGKITSNDARKLNNQLYRGSYSNGRFSGRFDFPGDENNNFQKTQGSWNLDFTNASNRFNL